MKQINIIIPVYNEEGNIDELYRQLKEFSNEYKYKMYFKFVFVNDGSKDGSHEKIINLKDKQVKYVKFSKNFGKEAAIIAGLDNSKEADGVTIIDSDLEMPIKYLSDMIEMWENGTKLVITRKINKRNTSRIKNFLAQKYYTVFKNITKQDIVENALDFVFMDNQVLKEVVKHREVNRFFKGIISSVGFDYKIVDVEIATRLSGKSSYNSFTSLFKYAFMSLASYTKLPLYVGIYLGFISALLGFLYGLVIILQYFAFDVKVAGYSSIMCVLLFFFGITLIVLGIIGYYIGLILDETMRRPLYIIDEIYEKED